MRSDEQVLGQYVLLERIGHGGMSEVYHARHTSTENQEVAIKIIRTDLADDRIASRRFQREAAALSRLSHPHILSLLAWGEDEGRLYLVLPWVREGTLSHLLKSWGHPLPVEEALPLFGQLCAAVQYAHEQDIIHRDIKPQNILVEQGTHLFLTDFGIARDHMDTRLTVTGGGMGSVNYMSPEQALGQASTRSDIYSLGVVLYQLLTGVVPFSGESPFHVMLQQAHAPLPDPHQFQPGLPTGLIHTLQTALAIDPDARFESAQDFWQAVQPFEHASSEEETATLAIDRERPGSRPLTTARPDWSAWRDGQDPAHLDLASRNTQVLLAKRAPAGQKNQHAGAFDPSQSTFSFRQPAHLSPQQRVFLGGIIGAAFLILMGAAALGLSQPHLATQQPSSASQSAPQPAPTKTLSPTATPSPTPGSNAPSQPSKPPKPTKTPKPPKGGPGDGNGPGNGGPGPGGGGPGGPGNGNGPGNGDGNGNGSGDGD